MNPNNYLRWGIFNAIIYALIICMVQLTSIYVEDIWWLGVVVILIGLASISFIQVVELPVALRVTRIGWLRRAIIGNVIAAILTILIAFIPSGAGIWFTGFVYGFSFAAWQGRWVTNQRGEGSWFVYAVAMALAYELVLASSVSLMVVFLFAFAPSPKIILIHGGIALMFGFLQMSAMSALLGEPELRKQKEKPKRE